MNVLMVSTNRTALPLPVLPFGACMVAEAAERAGHQVRVLDLMFEKSPLPAVASVIARMRPDVVALSVRNIDNNDMRAPVSYMQGLRALVETVRKGAQAPVVLGGPRWRLCPRRFCGWRMPTA